MSAKLNNSALNSTAATSQFGFCRVCKDRATGIHYGGMFIVKNDAY
jgi:hypothetical protein